MSDLRPPVDAALDAFGVAATVVVRESDPVDTTVIWLPPITEEYPTGSDHRRAAARRRMAVPLADVHQLPRGTVILAPEVAGDPPAQWLVDETEHVDKDHHRVVVTSVAVP